MKKIIGVDLDDVLMRFNEALCLWNNAQHGTSHTKADFYSYEFDRVWGCTNEEALSRVRAFCYSPEHADASPTEGAVEALRVLQKETLHIITARPPIVRKPSLTWIKKHFKNTACNIHFVGKDDEKEICHHTTSKPEMCKALGIEVFIDDSLVHARGIAKEGIPVFLFDAPWNQTEKLPSNVERVFSWQEIMKNLE